MVQPGPYQQRARELYSKLRKNIIENVHKVSGKPILRMVAVADGSRRSTNAPVTSGSSTTRRQGMAREGMKSMELRQLIY